ncbi:MAG: PilZ domain-containing protein, partial [Alphaproteobacteria bacterium]|nr:PilZ domain-containing protein [Alphaproteobacteria bacterium]
LQSIPSLPQGALVDLIDLEPQPIRASVVRQSDLGTHVSFIDHLHPRYTRTKKGMPNRRRHARVPCESPATIGPAIATVLNASLGGVMVRVTTLRDWSIGDRLTVTIDAHKRPLAGTVVAMSEDRLSIRFDRAQPLLRLGAADCVITVEQRQVTGKAKRMKAAKAARAPKAKVAARKKPTARKVPAKKAKGKAKAKAKTRAKAPARKARATAKKRR